MEAMPSVPEDLLSGVAIDPDIARAWTLPARFYLDPAISVLETQKIFRREWQVAAHRSQLARAGDYVTTEIAGEPLLLVCDADGGLRAFYNVCRHRAGPPATGCGSRKVFRCGYHGWTYGLDGRLISAPEFDEVQDFDPASFSLAPVHVEEWLGFIFVNLDANPTPLAGNLGALAEEPRLAASRPLRLFKRRIYEMNCNWKTYVDNYLEGYHLPSVHPGLNRELDYGAYAVEAHVRHVRQFSPIRKAHAGEAAGRRYQDSNQDGVADYFWIFPNWMINCYPDNLSLNNVLPIGAARSQAIFEWYLPEKEMGSSAAEASVEFSHQIQIEDSAICETVQKNLRSSSYDRGRYSVRQERGVHAFHRMYLDAMAE
jgi:choline monooxygenase